MVVHLLTNASVLDSPATFQKNVYSIHSLGVILPVVEWVFIFIPLLFHAIFGVLIIRGGAAEQQHVQVHQQRPLHAAAGDGHDRLCVHHVARVSHARLVSCRCLAEHDVAEPLGGAHVPAVQRRLHGGRGDAASMHRADSVRDRRPLLRVSPGQRHLDVRHHLGHLGHAGGAAVGDGGLPRLRRWLSASSAWVPSAALRSASMSKKAKKVEDNDVRRQGRVERDRPNASTSASRSTKRSETADAKTTQPKPANTLPPMLAPEPLAPSP